MGKQKGPVVTEFLVEVTAKEVRWGGLDAFLLWLLRKRPQEGFWPHGQTINRMRRYNRRLPAKR